MRTVCQDIHCVKNATVVKVYNGGVIPSDLRTSCFFMDTEGFSRDVDKGIVVLWGLLFAGGYVVYYA